MINICFCSDSNYLKPLELAIFSIVKNCKDKVSFHIIKTDSFSELNILELSSKYDFEVIFYELDIQLPPKGRFSKAMYGRLYLDVILPSSIERVIYLDCDLVVNKSISLLWNIDISDFPIGAVPEDSSIIKRSLMKRYTLNEYFNSGVLLINLKKVRSELSFQKVLSLLNDSKYRFEYPDQDALNVIFKNNWYMLPNIYNYTGLNFSPESVVIHYALSKPWDNDLNMNSYFYNEYARVYPLNMPFFKNDFKKKSLNTLKGKLVYPLRLIYWSWLK
ncbi:glycosyltransferase family 8 protein [Vibrio alginolyticus]|uniref:glycosyltransferase family 8 protein n=1 Tax=Vibrio alginolyticus TaxID=663 RepID=UPI001BD26858|nr:glycosyltransferase family 8 protein [Vibrio alginolyticus]ELP3325892.1 glycosyltransferase family 8 protein [Vibrio alginolyticus]MBS9914475.1 glycosyltransferase family 8 protein [Vibrio alginolyticus]